MFLQTVAHKILNTAGQLACFVVKWKKYKSKCKIHKIWPITLVSDGTDCAEASGYVSRNPVLGIK